MGKNVLKDKSYTFALKIVKCVENLFAYKKEYVLSKQLLKSGTAIGALVREAEFAQSKPDFVNKLSIALKEANETFYWISLLKDSSYIEEDTSNDLSGMCNELISILVSSIKTAKANT